MDALSKGRIIQGTQIQGIQNPRRIIQGHIIQRYNILPSTTTQGPELCYDVSGQQVPVLLLLDVSANVRLRLQHLPEQHEPVLLMDVSTPQVSELHLSVSGQQEPIIAATGSVYTTGFLAAPGLVEGLSCIRTCFTTGA
jgi:hypothetical protein